MLLLLLLLLLLLPHATQATDIIIVGSNWCFGLGDVSCYTSIILLHIDQQLGDCYCYPEPVCAACPPGPPLRPWMRSTHPRRVLWARGPAAAASGAAVATISWHRVEASLPPPPQVVLFVMYGGMHKSVSLCMQASEQRAVK